MLNILVCVKQVPDVEQLRMDPSTGALIREGVPSILNPLDANALAAAISVKERYPSEVTVITMGPPAAEAALRECLAMGADKAVLATDRAFSGSDTLATSLTIAFAAEETGKYDLIFCGRETIDGATGQMGPQLAERFNAAQITGALRILSVDESARRIIAERKADGGIETLSASFPCLLSIEKDNYPAIIPSLKNKLRSKKLPVLALTSKDIPGLEVSMTGDLGSPTKVPRMYPPELPEAGVMLDAVNLAEAAAEIAGLLEV